MGPISIGSTRGQRSRPMRKNTFLMTVAVAALLAGTGFASAQGSQSQPQMNQSGGAAGKADEKKAQDQKAEPKKPAATTGQSSGSSEMKAQDQKTQDKATDQKAQAP